MPAGYLTLPFTAGALMKQGQRVFNKGNQIAMGGGARGLRKFIGENQGYDDAPAAPEEVQRLANGQLLEKLQKQRYVDQAQLATTRPAAYPGKTIAPMSDLKQNERTLRAQYSGKQPKGKKIENLLRKESQGFSPEQRQNLIQLITGGDRAKDLAAERMQKTFGRNFGYSPERENRLAGKLDKDINNNLDITNANLNKTEEELRLAEDTNNLKNIEALKHAGVLKGARREAHFNQLGEFGNQKHAYDNLKLQSERDAFNEQAGAPYKKLAGSQAALAGVDVDDPHPDRAKLQNNILQDINNAYNTPYQAYPGQRVASLDPEVESSYRLAQQISPKYKDEFAGDRKGIEQGFQDNNLATQVFNKLPGAVESGMGNLDQVLKRQLKQISKDVGGHYVRQGTYGSGAHKAAVEKAFREAIRLGGQEKEGVVQGGIRSQQDLLKREAENERAKYGQMNQQGAQEFGTLLDKLKNKNTLGWEKTQNEQGKENQALQAWYGQVNNEFPTLQRMRGEQGYNEGLGVGRENASAPWMTASKQYGTNFQDLFRQPQLFDEENKAYNAYRTEQQRIIKDRNSAQAAEASARLEAEKQAAIQRNRKRAPVRAAPVRAAAPAPVAQAAPAAPIVDPDRQGYTNYQSSVANYFGGVNRDPRLIAIEPFVAKGTPRAGSTRLSYSYDQFKGLPENLRRPYY